MNESELQSAVADYLRLQYPEALFHSDFGSGIKLTKGQAIKQKRQNGGRRGWPDMFIAEIATEMWSRVDLAKHRREEYIANRHGLFLELKREGTRLKKKNGEWATPHIAEQAKVLEELRERGYSAKFAVGFEEAKRIIDEYLASWEWGQ